MDASATPPPIGAQGSPATIGASGGSRTSYQKPYRGCPLLQAAKDKKLREALVAELCDRDDIRAPGDIANLVMRVIKGMR